MTLKRTLNRIDNLRILGEEVTVTKAEEFTETETRQELTNGGDLVTLEDEIKKVRIETEQHDQTFELEYDSVMQIIANEREL